jgi:hypothetical protein
MKEGADNEEGDLHLLHSREPLQCCRAPARRRPRSRANDRTSKRCCVYLYACNDKRYNMISPHDVCVHGTILGHEQKNASI